MSKFIASFIIIFILLFSSNSYSWECNSETTKKMFKSVIKFQINDSLLTFLKEQKISKNEYDKIIKDSYYNMLNIEEAHGKTNSEYKACSTKYAMYTFNFVTLKMNYTNINFMYTYKAYDGFYGFMVKKFEEYSNSKNPNESN